MSLKTDRRQSAWHISACEDDKKCIRHLARVDAGDILHTGDICGLKVKAAKKDAAIPQQASRSQAQAIRVGCRSAGTGAKVMSGSGHQLKFWSLPH